MTSRGCDGKVAAARGGLELLLDNLDSVRVLGVGTGRTVEAFLRLSHGELAGRVYVAPSSLDTALRAAALGFRVLDPRSVAKVDAYIDGADEVVLGSGDMVKGGGGALLGEKILASISPLNIFIVDDGKVVERLAVSRGIPLEAVKGFLAAVVRRIESLGFRAEPRAGSGKRGPVISDWGGVIIDVYVDGGVDDAASLDSMLSSVPGVVATGLFHGVADYVVIGSGDGGCRVRLERYRRGT